MGASTKPGAIQVRQTKASTIAEIDKLLDHHTCAEIAAILRRRGLPNGEGRPFTRVMVQRVIRTYQLPSRRQRLLDAGLIPYEMAALLGVSTSTVKNWHHAGIVGGQRYNDKAEVLYHPPGPNPPPATKDAATTPSDLHERHLAAHRSEEVQYATRGFILGIWTPLSTTSIPASLSTASNSPGNLPSRSRIRNRARLPASSRSMTRFLAAWATQEAGRMRGRAQDPDPPTGVLDDRQHVQACAGQGDGLEEFGGKQGVGLGTEEGQPR